MLKQQRTFTKEFNLEAVPLVQTSGKSRTQSARDLCIADRTRNHWCNQFAQQGWQATPQVSGSRTPQKWGHLTRCSAVLAT